MPILLATNNQRALKLSQYPGITYHHANLDISQLTILTPLTSVHLICQRFQPKIHLKLTFQEENSHFSNSQK